MGLGRTASRSPSAFGRRLLRSSTPWTLRTSLSSCCFSVVSLFSALCAVILRCAPRQDRVASLTIWSRPILLLAGCTGGGCRLLLQWYTLLMVLHHRHAALLESVSTTTAFNTSQTNRSGLCFSLDRFGSDNTCRRADVHPVGSQPQSEKHSVEELPSQIVRSTSCPVQRKAEHALTENKQFPTTARCGISLWHA